MRKRLFVFGALICMIANISACADFEGALAEKENTTDETSEEKELEEYVEGVNKITIGDVNNDNKTDAIVVKNSVISLMSGKKVIQEFEPDEAFEYKKVNAIVNDIDGDNQYEIIVMASIGGNDPVYCMYILDKLNEDEYTIRTFPNELSSLLTNSGIDAQVVPVDFLEYEIRGEEFSFKIDVARSYGVSTLDEQGYRKLTESWEQMLDKKSEGKIMGIIRTEVVTDVEGKKFVRTYEMIYGADEKYIGALVVDIAFDAEGDYQIIDYGLFEHSIIMP